MTPPCQNYEGLTENPELALRTLRSENAFLRRRIKVKAILMPFLFSGIGAAIGFFVKVGVPVISQQWFSEKREFAARIVMYLFALCIVFPILACVISNSVNNERVLKALEMSREHSKPVVTTGNAVQRWWKDFTSPDNLTVNLCYYSISFLVACFFCFIQYVGIIGINELFSRLEHHRLEVVISISIVTGIGVAALGILFSSALQNLLYHKEPEFLPSSCFYMDGVQTCTELPSQSLQS